MASLTLSVPKDLKHKMNSFRYINWSEVARSAIINKIHLLNKMNTMLSKSRISQEDTVNYGRMIKKRQWTKTKKLLQ
ncbi:MAG: hypothetical protein AABZ65_01555 [Candidatus Omnitrophota bacterium]